jgi:hypothetical protein
MQSRQQISGIHPLPAISMLIAVIVIALLIAATSANDELAGKQANYCEMRQIHTDSGGLYGWPRLDGYGECK